MIGSGFAGEGHTRAFQHVGVEVVALCGRDESVVKARADALGVPLASTDWRTTLEQVRPELVAIATPAALRREVIEAALALGCHLYCDKPLATSAPEAKALFALTEAAGVKHAYAATRRYEPSVVWLAELVASGVIGEVKEVTYTLSAHLAPPLPWSWALVLEQGGGLLNGQLPHLLSILERVLGGALTGASGSAEFAIDRAQVVPGLHDFRDWGKVEIPAGAPWRACNADTAYTAQLTIAGVPVTLRSGPSEHGELRLIGERGTLVGEGELAFRVTLAGEMLPMPERLRGTLPSLDGNCQDRWAALARDFLADIRGEPHAPYLTFRDGWRYQAAIDAIHQA